MKIFILAGSLLLAISASSVAAEPIPPTLASLDREVADLTTQLKEAREETQSLKERVRTLEDRLGDSFGAPSPFNTVERRLDDLDRDVKNLKR